MTVFTEAHCYLMSLENNREKRKKEKPLLERLAAEARASNHNSEFCTNKRDPEKVIIELECPW